ncbi:MAG: DHH family phosphoesterase [Parcubacteria group bacterium]|jgi:nanoRNase/pAp phosphatase (c-di-AMP/oligoRNAs hydrolase)
MKNKIITSCHIFIDIDALACIFAYKELLDLKNEKVEMITTAKFNASITAKYRKINFKNKLPYAENMEFIVMDISEPDYFEEFVDLNSVSHIFDHHSGFETYWNTKIGKNAVIEHVGAAATLIYREYKKENLLNKISPLSAELLAVAILSNTLNFQSKITKQEDEMAYEELKKFFNYTPDFEKDYFLEVQKNIEKNVIDSLKNDSKQVNSELFIAQLEVWDSEHIIHNFSKEIQTFLQSPNSKFSFLNLIELSKKNNILIFNDRTTLEYIKKHFPEFNYNLKNNTATTSNVILRKEIIKKIDNINHSLTT